MSTSFLYTTTCSDWIWNIGFGVSIDRHRDLFYTKRIL